MNSAQHCRLLLVTVLSLVAMAVCIIIPDSAQEVGRRWVYYENKARLSAAEQVCRREGGNLLAVDTLSKFQQLHSLSDFIRTTYSKTPDVIITALCLHEDNQVYVSNSSGCTLADTFARSLWKDNTFPTYKAGKTCVVFKFSDGYFLEEESCASEQHFVCEFPSSVEAYVIGKRIDHEKLSLLQNHRSWIGKNILSVHTDFIEMSNMTLTAVSVLNNTKTYCQETCLRMTGCYAAMPSNNATSTQCYFLLVESNINTMMAYRPNSYGYNTTALKTQSTSDTSTRCCQNATTNIPSVGVLMSSGDVQSQAPIRTNALTYVWSDAATRHVACTPQTSSTVVTMTPDVLTSYLTLPSVVLTENILGPLLTIVPSLTLTMTYPTVLVTCLPFAPQVSVVTNDLSCPIAPNVSSFNDLSSVLNLLAAHNIHSVLAPSGLNQTVQDMEVLLNALLNYVVNEHVGGAVNDLVNGAINNLGLVNVKDLAVNHTTVSRARRKRESAPDQRPSAQSLGISAICLLFCIMLLIIFFDLPVLYRGFCPRQLDERAALRRQTQVM